MSDDEQPVERNGLRQRVDALNSTVTSILAATGTFRWIIAVVGTASIAIGWGSCNRAIDNETQIKINSGRLTSIESALGRLEIDGSESSKANTTAIISLDRVVNDLSRKVDAYHENAASKYESYAKAIAELRAEIEMHIHDDNMLRPAPTPK